MKEYTCEEIKKEMEVLKRTFAIVRIVDPSVCRFMEFSDSGETLQLTPCDICYDVWNYSSQCTNCTSARALRRSETMSKCETFQNKIFNISAKPITVDGKPLICEIPTQHLVFQNQLLPFEIEVGCADLSNESYSSADELFETLQKRL